MNQTNNNTCGNSATYFTRADEHRLDELSWLLGLSDDHHHNNSTINSNQHDPLARSVYESEYQELKRRKDRFIEESLDNMMRAAKQQKTSSNLGSSSRVFHAFDPTTSSDGRGDGSFSYLISRAVSSVLSSLTSSTSTSTTSTVPSAIVTSLRGDNGNNSNKTFEGENREVSSVLSRKQSDADFHAADYHNNNNPAPTPSKNKRLSLSNDDSVNSSTSSSMFILPISVTFAWSIYGACSLALLMQSLMHFQDPSRTIRKSTGFEQFSPQRDNNNNNANDHDYHYNSNGGGGLRNHAIFHEESFMSMLLRFSEGFLGFVGCCALILHLSFVSGQSSSSSTTSLSTTSSSAAASSSSATLNANSNTVLSGRNTARHSRSASLQHNPISVVSSSATTTTTNPSAFSPVIVPITLNQKTAFHTNSLVTPANQSSVVSSTPVRLLLRICEIGTLFFGVYALVYAAVLLAPLHHVSSANYLKQHIIKEQNLRHVEAGLVLFWMSVDAVCALAVRRIMFTAEQMKTAGGGSSSNVVDTSVAV